MAGSAGLQRLSIVSKTSAGSFLITSLRSGRWICRRAGRSGKTFASSVNVTMLAEAICEAVGRPSMRFVPPKSTDQLAVQAVHRIRRRLVADRVKLVNQIRGLLSEHGIVIARDISQLRRSLADIVGNIDDGLSDLVRSLMRELQAEMAELDRRIASYDRRIREIFRNSEQCQRLGKIEGIGPVTATALIAAVGDRTCFKNGRQFAAWLGLVPKQRSSGGRARLFGISKRGDRYLRTLMIHGARAALGKAARQAGSSKPLAW